MRDKLQTLLTRLRFDGMCAGAMLFTSATCGGTIDAR